MRRTLTVALVACMIGGALIGPADAKKKKKPAPPVTFSADGEMAVGNTADYLAQASVTRNEFLQTCAIPASQGLDGFVVELSEEISKVTATVMLSGSDALGAYDLDMFFFDASCGATGEFNTAEPNESGVMGSGTKYVLVTSFAGAEIAFHLEATELR